MEKEFVTFMITTTEGKEVELAVVDEFVVDNKNYVAAARVEGDTICNDGVYIYKVKDGDEFQVEKISNHVDYEKVVKAYGEMDV
ncbi:MAG: DUF1292 domain-containing protein [Lachnospiraceae bacterium]|nr:DUF1292 domain-containing protein [Lachnospiraceae bacterium]